LRVAAVLGSHWRALLSSVVVRVDSSEFQDFEFVAVILTSFLAAKLRPFFFELPQLQISGREHQYFTKSRHGRREKAEDQKISERGFIADGGLSLPCPSKLLLARDVTPNAIQTLKQIHSVG